jgi:hypothetical protein
MPPCGLVAEPDQPHARPADGVDEGVHTGVGRTASGNGH